MVMTGADNETDGKQIITENFGKTLKNLRTERYDNENSFQMIIICET